MSYFTKKKFMENFFQIEVAGKSFLKNIDQLIKKEKKNEFDVKDLVKSYALDIIAKIVFSLEINSFEEKNHPFVINIKTLSNPSGFRILLSVILPEFILKIFNISFFDLSAMDNYYKTTSFLIKKRLENKQKFNDFLEFNLKALEEDEKSMSSKEVIANSLVLFFAGIETVSLTASIIMFNLALYQEWQDKLREELKETYKDKKITLDNLNETKLLDLFIKESLRVYPATNRLFRIVQKDCTLKNYKLKAGELVSINVYGLHMDPDFWEEPEKFKPQRFMEDNSKINDYYIPFGYGPRYCAGKRLALIEIKYFIVNLILNYKIYKTDKTDCPPDFFKNENAFVLKKLYLGFEKQAL